MDDILRNMSEFEFVAYLRRVGGDYRESGSEATADDYVQAAARIESLLRAITHLKNEIPHLEQAAYAAALEDMAVESQR